MLETVDEAVGLYLGKNADEAEAVVRLLSDLHTYCDTGGIDFDSALAKADIRYQTEAA